MSLSSSERGVVLGAVIIMAVVFGIAAFGLLYLSMNRTQQSSFIGEERLRARYAAEAGLVTVMSKLFNDPALPGSPWSVLVDTDNDGTNETTVQVFRAGSKLQAKVTW